MSVGPTEEGSIVAHVQAELSDFDAGMDKADARVDRLATSDPTVHVKAAVDEAIAKIDTVDRAVNKLGDDQVKASAKTVAAQAAVEQATKRQSIATEALKLAYQRLDDIQSRDSATSLQVAAGHLAAARAENAQERATLALAAANEVLKRSQANDATPPPSTPASSGASTAGATGAGAATVVPALIASLIPLIASLAGYAAAVTGSLMGMGAAGVLAVLGIKNAMAQGTAAGNVFSGGLHLLKGDLDQLSNTAAVGMLVSFQRAVDLIDSSMPSLNNEIRLFSGLLGTTGDIVLSTLISGFKTLLPLFMQGGVYVEQLAVGFQKWTTNGGLAKWAADASVALPQVANSLGSLLHGILSVLGALQPLGTVMLGIISIVGNVLTLLSHLGPVLPVVAAGALVVYGAFRGWSALTPMIVNLVTAVAKLPQTIQDLAGRMVAFLASTNAQTAATVEQTAATEALAVAETDAAVATDAVGAATKAALPVIGVILAVVSAVAVAFMTAAAATNNATDATNNYTAAIQEDNGAIGKNTAAQVANNLGKSGALDIAAKLGISTKTLTEATLGNGQAQDIVAKKIAALTEKLHQMDLANAKAADTTAGAQTQAAAKLADQLQKLTAEYAGQQQQVQKAWKSYNEIAAAQGLTTYKTKAQQDAVTALAATYGESVGVYLNAKGAQKQAADQLAATTALAVQQNDAVTLLNNAFTILNGGSLDIAQAQTGAAAAFNSLTDSIKQNGTAIDGNSKAAVANQQAIQQKVLADQAAATAVQKTTGSVDAGVKAYGASKQALEDQLKAVGDLTPAMQAYIDKLYDVADFKPTVTQFDADTSSAMKKIAALSQYLKEAIPTNVRLGVHVDTSGNAAGGTIGRANGGSIGLAGGGTSGTVFGPGSSTSDSIVTRLSVGEEVIRTAAANQGRPFLKMFNQDPGRALASVAAAGAAAAPTIDRSSHLHVDGAGWNVPQLFAEFTRRNATQSEARAA